MAEGTLHSTANQVGDELWNKLLKRSISFDAVVGENGEDELLQMGKVAQQRFNGGPF